MKRISIILLAVTLLFACRSMGRGRGYEDLKATLNDFIESCEVYLIALERNDTPEGVASAINSFVDSQNVLRPQLERLMTKYPELSEKDNMPEDVMKLTKRLYNLMYSPLSKSADEKLKRFKDNPLVMEALIKLQTLR